ncbi:bromodomain adjacent to zinc finger domain protein 1A isoform X2 [Galleria mellonella]|uniref:Bromodomain adjacent to zinc finger domain protein 1A isoform X2 n=1 Tax=Galleria mellonella TaxID=7137 RepID=A0ABM3MZ57_GALME|nr:bromodomain adjacent to zinc finger domain protein 1A isoform X2 [Galleria mellonella]
MPLLKRKAFEKSTASEYLRDDDEVFHCEITDEIFKDYEEYCERIILVNSMVWTCEMTGKNNLTYAEALESEKAARRSLKDFPMELRIPILFLAARTKRSSFADMSEDVFNFVRERYFVGETVEACLEGDIWREAHVLSVTAQKQHPDSKTTLPSSSYCYEVEQFDESEPSATGQIGTAPHDRVRRRKGVYTRDKNRLFLKQFVELSSPGVISIKKAALDKYNISKVSFDQIFTGGPPEFPSSKKLMKNSLSPAASKNQTKPNSANKLNKSGKKTSPDKKGRQESMDKFVKKTEKPEVKQKPPIDPAAKKSAQELAEKMRRAEDQMRQRKEEEKAKKKEKTARLQAYLKEWQKVKDDLELEDHKIIPKGTPVEIEGIPQKHFGDFLSVLEFVSIYADVLKVKDVFHNELDLETFRKALTIEEHANLFSDLVQMFLTTIFSLQEDEAEEYNENKGIQESTEVKKEDTEIGMNTAVELATKASKWSQTYLGTPLSKLPLDATTVSEVLRLHLLSSGAAPGSRCATWRYHQRGGYSSADDAGLALRRRRPELLRRLATSHVAELHLDDKLQILQCLMHQILSYATVRDIIEEKLEELRNTKQALRLLTANERKREAQLIAARQELKKEAAAKKEEGKLTGEKAKAVDEELRLATEKLNKENEVKKHEYEKRSKELQVALFDYTSYIGSDRAFRRYWVNQRVPGLFVEAGDEPRGGCRDKPVPPAPPHPGDTLAYVAELFESERERAGSDKENDSGPNSRGGSPKKPLASVNGLHKLNGLDSNTQQLRELLVCTGDLSSCLVHGTGEHRPQWWVYHSAEQVEALVAALNRRGLREAELRQALELDRRSILHCVAKCPLHLLNPAAAPTVGAAAAPRRGARGAARSARAALPEAASLADALELSLRDHILELEEKIFHGCLGVLKVKDREAWRGTIMVRGYDKQAEYLTWGPQRQYRDDYHLPNGVLRLPPDIDETDVKIPVNKYRDPGHYLEAPRANGVRPDRGTPGLVRTLASALLQVEQALHHKYLKRPLGLDDKERKDREARNKPLDLEALERWEVSLMECQSFAQIVLHLLTLDSSITWSASILNASCRLCRRKADPDNMLLCDGCNKGHHLYCLKPKLASGPTRKKVPDGDWFCDQCKPKERTPRKRRKLFSEEDLEEALDDSSSSSCSSSTSSSSPLLSAVCGTCGSGGRLAAACDGCGARYHRECARPAPPARAARRWRCDACLHPAREHSVRRCAAAAISNIHQYTRALDSRRNSSDSDDSEYNTALVKLKGRRSRGSKEQSPLQNGGAKRGRKPKSHANTSTGRRSKTSLTNGVDEERTSGRKRSARYEEAEGEEEDGELHAERLQQLLRDVMKHRDCWPFYEPVSTDDVPDYLDIIEQPMDFSTIKSKLDGGEYATDGELIADAALVLTNCYTYNKDTHPVAKAGWRLEKYINKRCAELKLPSLPEIQLDQAVEEGEEEEEEEAMLRHKRAASSEAEAPRAKRPKHK